MAMVAPKSGTKSGDFKVVPAGPHVATLFAVLDIGTHLRESQKFGNSWKRQIMLRWELPDETIEWEGEQRPMVVSKTFTFSMHENSNLRPFIEGLVTRSLTEAEAIAFDFEGLAGTPCQINVSHYTKKDGTSGADVVSMSPLGKRTQPPEPINDTIVYSVSNGLPPDDFPDWLKEKIGKCQEFAGTPPASGQPAAAGARQSSAATTPPGGNDPISGREFFGWLKDRGDNILRYVTNWGKLQDFPSRIVDWDVDQVEAAHTEAVRKLEQTPPPAKSADVAFQEPGIDADEGGHDDEDDDLPDFLKK